MIIVIYAPNQERASLSNECDVARQRGAEVSNTRVANSDKINKIYDKY